LFDGRRIGGAPGAHLFAAVGGIGHGDVGAAGGHAGHERQRAPVAGHGGVELFGEGAQLRVVCEVEAHGVVSFVCDVVRLAAIDVARQRNARMRNGVEPVDDLDRVASPGRRSRRSRR
jgi:hypothetical protein